MTIAVSVTLEKTQQQQETHKLISDGLGYIHVHNIYTLVYEKQQHETATSQGWGYNNNNTTIDTTLNKSGWRDTNA